MKIPYNRKTAGTFGIDELKELNIKTLHAVWQGENLLSIPPRRTRKKIKSSMGSKVGASEKNPRLPPPQK